jgi:hypothetical protein
MVRFMEDVSIIKYFSMSGVLLGYKCRKEWQENVTPLTKETT